MLSALWVTGTGQLALIVHHLAVDAVSWRILLEDLNIAWAQHHNGQPITLPAGGNVVPAVGITAQRARPHLRRWWIRPTPGSRSPPTPAALPAVRPELDTYASAGRLSVDAGCRHHPPAAR